MSISIKIVLVIESGPKEDMKLLNCKIGMLTSKFHWSDIISYIGRSISPPSGSLHVPNGEKHTHSWL